MAERGQKVRVEDLPVAADGARFPVEAGEVLGHVGLGVVFEGGASWFAPPFPLHFVEAFPELALGPLAVPAVALPSERLLDLASVCVEVLDPPGHTAAAFVFDHGSASHNPPPDNTGCDRSEASLSSSFSREGPRAPRSGRRPGGRAQRTNTQQGRAAQIDTTRTLQGWRSTASRSGPVFRVPGPPPCWLSASQASTLARS